MYFPVRIHRARRAAAGLARLTDTAVAESSRRNRVPLVLWLKLALAALIAVGSTSVFLAGTAPSRSVVLAHAAARQERLDQAVGLATMGPVYLAPESERTVSINNANLRALDQGLDPADRSGVLYPLRKGLEQLAGVMMFPILIIAVLHALLTARGEADTKLRDLAINYFVVIVMLWGYPLWDYILYRKIAIPVAQAMTNGQVVNKISQSINRQTRNPSPTFSDSTGATNFSPGGELSAFWQNDLACPVEIAASTVADSTAGQRCYGDDIPESRARLHANSARGLQLGNPAQKDTVNAGVFSRWRDKINSAWEGVTGAASAVASVVSDPKGWVLGNVGNFLASTVAGILVTIQTYIGAAILWFVFLAVIVSRAMSLCLAPIGIVWGLVPSESAWTKPKKWFLGHAKIVLMPVGVAFGLLVYWAVMTAIFVTPMLSTGNFLIGLGLKFALFIGFIITAFKTSTLTNVLAGDITEVAVDFGKAAKNASIAVAGTVGAIGVGAVAGGLATAGVAARGAGAAAASGGAGSAAAGSAAVGGTSAGAGASVARTAAQMGTARNTLSSTFRQTAAASTGGTARSSASGGGGAQASTARSASQRFRQSFQSSRVGQALRQSKDVAVAGFRNPWLVTKATVAGGLREARPDHFAARLSAADRNSLSESLDHAVFRPIERAKAVARRARDDARGPDARSSNSDVMREIRDTLAGLPHQGQPNGAAPVPASPSAPSASGPAISVETGYRSKTSRRAGGSTADTVEQTAASVASQGTPSNDSPGANPDGAAATATTGTVLTPAERTSLDRRYRKDPTFRNQLEEELVSTYGSESAVPRIKHGDGWAVDFDQVVAQSPTLRNALERGRTAAGPRPDAVAQRERSAAQAAAQRASQSADGSVFADAIGQLDLESVRQRAGEEPAEYGARMAQAGERLLRVAWYIHATPEARVALGLPAMGAERQAAQASQIDVSVWRTTPFNTADPGIRNALAQAVAMNKLEVDNAMGRAAYSRGERFGLDGDAFLRSHGDDRRYHAQPGSVFDEQQLNHPELVGDEDRLYEMVRDIVANDPRYSTLVQGARAPGESDLEFEMRRAKTLHRAMFLNEQSR